MINIVTRVRDIIIYAIGISVLISLAARVFNKKLMNWKHYSKVKAILKKIDDYLYKAWWITIVVATVVKDYKDIYMWLMWIIAILWTLNNKHYNEYIKHLEESRAFRVKDANDNYERLMSIMTFIHNDERVPAEVVIELQEKNWFRK